MALIQMVPFILTKLKSLSISGHLASTISICVDLYESLLKHIRKNKRQIRLYISEHIIISNFVGHDLESTVNPEIFA